MQEYVWYTLAYPTLPFKGNTLLLDNFNTAIYCNNVCGQDTADLVQVYIMYMMDNMDMLDSLNILDILDMVPHTDTGSQFHIFARRSRREEEIGKCCRKLNTYSILFPARRFLMNNQRNSPLY